MVEKRRARMENAETLGTYLEEVIFCRAPRTALPSGS
jgi:hypothetical protein